MDTTARRSSRRSSALPVILVILSLGSVLTIFSSNGKRIHSPGLHGTLRRDVVYYGRQEQPVPTSSTTSLEIESSSSLVSSSSRSSSSSGTIPFSRTSSSFSSSSTSDITSISSSSSPTSSSQSNPDIPSSIPTTPSTISSTSEASSTFQSASNTEDLTSSSSSAQALIPSTTLRITGNLFTPRPSLPMSTNDGTNGRETPSNTDEVGAASKGFWGNKPAVAATFVIVSLVAIGLAALFIINFMKKRNKAKQRRLHHSLFGEKQASSNGGSRDGSITGTPMDAFSRRDIVYDDSRFQGATVTSSYPFAGSASAVGSSQPRELVSSSRKAVSYQPPNSAQSQGSQQTTYWTPNPSQHSLSTQQHGHQGVQYLPPSQSNPFADPSEYPAPTNAGYTNVNSGPANYMNSTEPKVAPTAYDSIYGGISTSVYGGMAPTGAAYQATHDYNADTTTSITAAPPVAPNNSQIRESYDSFFGYNAGAQPPNLASGFVV